MFKVNARDKDVTVSYSAAYYVVFIPTFSFMIALFALFAIMVDIVFMKCVFWGICLIFGVCLALFLIFARRFRLTIDQNGVFCRRRAKTTFLKWDQINEISICCSEEKDTVSSYHRYHPVTSIYFSSRHLTEYEKMYFYDKPMPAHLKIIVWTEITTDELEGLMERLAFYVHRFSDIEITRFNSHFLRYGVK